LVLDHVLINARHYIGIIRCATVYMTNVSIDVTFFLILDCCNTVRAIFMFFFWAKHLWSKKNVLYLLDFNSG